MAKKTWTGATSGDLNVSTNYSPSGVPAAGDDLTFPAGAPSVTLNPHALNNATLGGALGVVVVESGFSGLLGAAGTTLYLQFTPTQFYFSGSGLAYIDLEAAAITPHIYATARPSGVGLRGLYLLGSALAAIDALGGFIGVAAQFAAETAAITAVRNSGADLWLKAGVSAPTSVEHTGGTTEMHCGATTVNIYGGTFRTREAGAITTANMQGGLWYPESTGTITTANFNGGTTDFTTSGAARTVTTRKINPGATVIYDPAVVTFTNKSEPDYPVKLQAIPIGT